MLRNTNVFGLSGFDEDRLRELLTKSQTSRGGRNRHRSRNDNDSNKIGKARRSQQSKWKWIQYKELI